MLSVAGLRKRYGAEEVVAGVDFNVQPGECFGLLGPNGAGKTTTLKLALGLINPDAGDIRLLDRPVPGEAREARHHVGVVPQFDNLDPDFTASENLMVYGRYFGLKRQNIEARIPQLLEFAGLAGRGGAKIQTLSGGMKRRLTLARALINDPQVVFMDEPTTGLDPQARHLIWERLKRLKQEGKTLLLTTHFMEEAERLCSRLVIMDHGRIVAEGSPRELIGKHIEPHVVEVHGPGFGAWAEMARTLAGRVEIAGETAFCYAADEAPLLGSLKAEPQLVYLHRPANLEDVFLKLTGRDLRD
ncbi:MAG: ATP-binding cassette domain-containing protein [Betaproteobacteria bacterium]|nr:ATP-binding cassette domain-containing protein [Betaproteobacteria bacterium]